MSRLTRVTALLGAAAMATAFVPGTTPAAEQLVASVPVADAALVADAGSSLLLGAGERGTFHGTAFGAPRRTPSRGARTTSRSSTRRTPSRR